MEEDGSSSGIVRMRGFPPFYTLQRVQSTREKQLSAWVKLLLEECRAARTLVLEGDRCPWLANRDINRSATPELVTAILTRMVEEDHAAWRVPNKSVFVFWRAREDWARMVLQWAVDSGNVENVLTIFELLEGAATEKQEFHGLPEDFFLAILRHLQSQGKAVLFGCEEGGEEESAPTGVKFFA